MAEKIVNATGLEEFSKEIKKSVPLIGSSTSGSSFSFDSMGSYSLEEMETPFKWIDGKTIYKKTIDCGPLPAEITKYVPHNVDNLDFVLKVESIAYNTTNHEHFSLHFASSTQAHDCIEIFTNRTHIRFYSNTNWSGYSSFTTIYYTKL